MPTFTGKGIKLTEKQVKKLEGTTIGTSLGVPSSSSTGQYGAAGRGEYGAEDVALYQAADALGVPMSSAEVTRGTTAYESALKNTSKTLRNGSSSSNTSKTSPIVSNSRRSPANTTGRTPNSAGSFYGSAGTNAMATSFDAAGNSILGTTASGRNIIGGQGSRVDRTAGVGADPMSQYMQMFSPTAAVDRQAQIRREMARERQKQIDAIELSAKQAVTTEQAAGAQDLARQRSMNLRSGLGGSDFGAANKAEVRNRTNEAVQGINAQKDIAIGNAIDNIERLAQSRFQIEQNAMQQGFSNLMQVHEYTQAQEQQMRAQTLDSLKALGQSGMDIQTIKQRDPDLYEKLTAASGMSDVEVEAVLNNAKPAPERTDYQYKVMGNKLIAFGVDPMTGQLKTMEQEVDMPDNYSVTTMPDGTVLGIPAEWDGDTSKIVTVGNYRRPFASEVGGGGTTTTSTGGGAVVDANGKPLKLTATQTDALSGFENTMQASADALGLLDLGVSTGPVAGRVMGLGKFFGNVDDNQLKLEQMLGKIKADFMKAMSGAAVSEQEVQRLSKFLPDMNDQENVMKSKLNTLIQETARSKQNLLNTLGAVQQSSAEIEVRSPNGVVGTIPATQLQEALAEGYTQV